MKIFGIGFHKTGTSSLREALKILGYNVCPEELAYRFRKQVAAGVVLELLDLADSFDAFEDSPWNYSEVYKVLDEAYPEAKFILTVRNTDTWFDSILRWANFCNSNHDLSFYSTVGCSILKENEEQIKRKFEDCNLSTIIYFSERSNKLLVLDFELGSGWTELCEFLQKPIPSLPFPHVLRYDHETGTYK
jgi:hypothetical protein